MLSPLCSPRPGGFYGTSPITPHPVSSSALVPRWGTAEEGEEGGALSKRRWETQTGCESSSVINKRVLFFKAIPAQNKIPSGAQRGRHIPAGPPRHCAALQVSCRSGRRCAPSPRPPAGDTPGRRAPDPYWPPPSSPPPCVGRRAPTAPPGKRLAGGDPREGVGGLPRDGIECPRGMLGPWARRHGAGRGARCPPGTCPPPPGPRPPSERCRRLSSLPAPATASPLGGFAARAEVRCSMRPPRNL